MDGWTAVLDDISAVAVIVLVGYLVLSGKLRTDRNVQEIREDRDSRLENARADADRWREAYLTAEGARRDLQEAVMSLLEVGRTTEAVLRAIDEQAKSKAGEDE